VTVGLIEIDLFMTDKSADNFQMSPVGGKIYGRSVRYIQI
jgi:hypothetical protein